MHVDQLNRTLGLECRYVRWLIFLALVACTEAESDAPEEAWRQRPDLPSRRLEAAAAANGTRLVVFGGFKTGAGDTPRLEITNEVLQYDPYAKPEEAWSVLPPAPVAWTHAALVGNGGTLYLLGGLEGETFVPRGEAWRLAAGADKWEELAPMPAGLERGAAAVVHSQGHIFLFGGEGPNGVTDTILDYVIADDEWKQLMPSLPTPRSHAAAMREEDGTFVIAGGVAPQGPLGDVYAYTPFDMANPGWRVRAPMSAPHGGCAYGTIYGQLVCAGGETIENGMVVPSRVVELYDYAQNTWTVTTEMPFARGGAPGAIVTSRLYVVGGSQTIALEPTSTLFEFDLFDISTSCFGSSTVFCTDTSSP